MAAFLQEKYLLFGRVDPTSTDEAKFCTMLDLVRPALRKVLRIHTFDSYTALLSMAVTVEADDEEECTLNKITENSRKV